MEYFSAKSQIFYLMENKTYVKIDLLLLYGDIVPATVYKYSTLRYLL